MSALNVHVVLGSVREGRMAGPVGRWVQRTAADRSSMNVEVVDLGDWDLPFFALPKSPAQGDYEDALQKKWAAKVAEADAYVFISPEYNHGYSAVLKNALDYVYAEYNRKPAAFVSYGGVEGARSVEQLRQIVVELQMAPLRNAVHIRGVWGKVEDRNFQPADKDNEMLDKCLDELQWWGDALKTARNAS